MSGYFNPQDWCHQSARFNSATAKVSMITDKFADIHSAVLHFTQRFQRKKNKNIKTNKQANKTKQKRKKETLNFPCFCTKTLAVLRV